MPFRIDMVHGKGTIVYTKSVVAREGGVPREETERNMYEAIQMHIEGLTEDGLPIPQSTAFAEYVVVGA